MPGTHATKPAPRCGKANEAFDGFKTVSDRASRNLENLENFTKPLGERGPQTRR